MAHAEKREGKLTGYWYGEVDLRHKGSIRFRRRFETRREAQGYEAYVKSTGQEMPGTDGEASGRTFKSVAQECKAAGGKAGAWKSGRDDSVVQRLEAVCNMRLGNLPIEGVTNAELRKLVETLERKPGKAAKSKMAVGTINRYLTAVSAVMSYALSVNYIKATPEVPWRREAKQSRFHWLTEAQEDNVCGKLTEAGYVVEAFCVRVLTRTGLRMGEFLGLEPTQVEDRWVRLWETKTDTPRSVPISTDLARELRANVAAGNLPKYDTLHKRFAQAVKSCGYSEALTPHCLRHTFATRLIQANVSVAKVQRLLGHKSIQTTMRYTHIHDDDLTVAVENLYPHRGELRGSADVVSFPMQQNQKVGAG